MEYQFQVVAIAVINGQTIEGERSVVVTSSMSSNSPQGTFMIGILFVFSLCYL